MDARRRAASNAPSHAPEDPLYVKPVPLPSRAAVRLVAGVAPAPAADVAGLGPPQCHCQWAPWAPLTGLTQSTADWAGPVTDMRAPPQKYKKEKKKKMFYK